MQKAIFGAGCFWQVQKAFDEVKGVISTTVGYMGGKFENPTYEDVCTNTTGHAEVVQIEYDENRISYEDILDVFWKIHDPTQLNMQGPDVGMQYRSVIFYLNEEQKKKAIRSKERLQNSGRFANKKIVTEISPSLEFYRAEEYHQKYLLKKGG